MASRGYDMTPTMYSPDGRIYQVEYAIETVKRGTLAIGISTKQGVIMAVEEKARTLQTKNITQKIFQVDYHIGLQQQDTFQMHEFKSIVQEHFHKEIE